MSEQSDQFASISKRLEAYYSPEERARWWCLPHPQLDGMTALAVLCTVDGGDKRVSEVIDRMDAGEYL